MYLHHILSRGKEELIRKIYEAQKRKPVKNDWINIIKRDCEELKITYNESQIISLNKSNFKNIVREKIRTNAFKYLIEIKISQSKLSDIEYSKFEMQNYLRSSKLTNEEKSLLFRIRTRTVDDIKTNFRTKFGDDLRCRMCDSQDLEESQCHLLVCATMIEECIELRINSTVKYEDFFGGRDAQITATRLYKKVLEVRQRLLEERERIIE